MKLLSRMIFGVVALCAATFATAASAKADDFGVFIGTNGFGVQYSNYDHGYYGYAPVGHYNRGYDRCRDRWYRRHHRHCWNYGGHGYYGNNYYHPGYYGHGYYPYHRRHYRGHWYPRHQWRGNWGHHDGWRGGRHGGHGKHRGWRDRHRGH